MSPVDYSVCSPCPRPTFALTRTPAAAAEGDLAHDAVAVSKISLLLDRTFAATTACPTRPDEKNEGEGVAVVPWQPPPRPPRMTARLPREREKKKPGKGKLRKEIPGTGLGFRHLRFVAAAVAGCKPVRAGGQHDSMMVLVA